MICLLHSPVISSVSHCTHVLSQYQSCRYNVPPTHSSLMCAWTQRTLKVQEQQHSVHERERQTVKQETHHEGHHWITGRQQEAVAEVSRCGSVSGSNNSALAQGRLQNKGQPGGQPNDQTGQLLGQPITKAHVSKSFEDQQHQQLGLSVCVPWSPAAAWGWGCCVVILT